jgi:lysozyme
MKYNRGDIEGAADEFLKWNKAGGKILAGLTRRRAAERALFLS